VFHHFGGRGKSSGLEVGKTTSKGASLFHIVDGKVTKLVLYAVRDLADLGLEGRPFVEPLLPARPRAYSPVLA
jgi:hypothetical protein